MRENIEVGYQTFASDGGDTVHQLQLYLNPQAEHLLDWFHVTLRITVMTQMAKGLEGKDGAIRTTANAIVMARRLRRALLNPR
jgi:hypothetical protein